MSTPKLSFLATLRQSGRQALQWRLLLLWVLVLLVPTAILALPFWMSLSATLDHSLYAAQWARQLDALMLSDVMSRLMEHSAALGHSSLIAMVLTLLFSPFLTGMVITTARAQTVPGFATLIQGGVREYGRLLRMLVWALVPLGLAIALGSVGTQWAETSGDKAILESAAQLHRLLALGVMGVLLWLAHASVDAGRAQFALFSKRRSAVKAWWRGLQTLRHNLLPMLGGYLVVTVVGLLLVIGLTALRLAMPQLGAFWMVMGLLLAQVVIAILVWMRIARLLTLIAQSRNQTI
ncbi:MAG: hypothetical protein H7Y28_09975 [Rhodoferax sp.]|nr:hypothetical protein [Rhodoferax sp.]